MTISLRLQKCCGYGEKKNPFSLYGILKILFRYQTPNHWKDIITSSIINDSLEVWKQENSWTDKRMIEGKMGKRWARYIYNLKISIKLRAMMEKNWF